MHRTLEEIEQFGEMGIAFTEAAPVHASSAPPQGPPPGTPGSPSPSPTPAPTPTPTPAPKEPGSE